MKPNEFSMAGLGVLMVVTNDMREIFNFPLTLTFFSL